MDLAAICVALFRARGVVFKERGPVTTSQWSRGGEVRANLAVLSLWLFRTVRLLNLSLVIVERSHRVLKWWRPKNEISEIIGFVRIFWKNNVQELRTTCQKCMHFGANCLWDRSPVMLRKLHTSPYKIFWGSTQKYLSPAEPWLHVQDPPVEVCTVGSCNPFILFSMSSKCVRDHIIGRYNSI